MNEKEIALPFLGESENQFRRRGMQKTGKLGRGSKKRILKNEKKKKRQAFT